MNSQLPQTDNEELLCFKQNEKNKKKVLYQSKLKKIKKKKKIRSKKKPSWCLPKVFFF